MEGGREGGGARRTLGLATRQDLLHLSRKNMQEFNSWVEAQVGEPVEEEGEVLREEGQGEQLGGDGVTEAEEERTVQVGAAATVAAAAAAAVDNPSLFRKLEQASEKLGETLGGAVVEPRADCL